MAIRTDNLPQATTLSLTDEFIGNTSLETVRATLQVLLNTLSPNIISTGTAEPTSSTAGLIYIQTADSAISKVYGKAGTEWLEFP